MTAYYNEIDPYAADWLKNLIAAGHIAPGDVDRRSIVDVRPDDVRGYRQCHFFAGIGGWSYALRLAGWPDDRPVWTGSCPCQPLSSAGKRRGDADERHLWPAFYELIAECRPATIFGEQVASKDGREWLSGVRADLEGSGYACGIADLCAASVGAPHIRQRLWWVANSQRAERRAVDHTRRDAGRDRIPQGEEGPDLPRGGCEDGGLANANGGSSRQGRANSRRRNSGSDAKARGRPSGDGHVGPWSDAEWIACSDGKSRRVESGTFPLAHGVPRRVGQLRAYGNAICPQVAAEFIGAFMECQP